MYEYFVSDEMARMTIIIGVVVATIIYKRTGLTLGGVIVCGYLALLIAQPLHILVTLLISYITYEFVHNVLKKRYMLNGRKLFEVEILVGMFLQVTWLTIIRLLALRSIDLAALYGVGFVIPGVIAHDMGRQGPKSTIGSILLGVFIVALIIIPLSAVEQLIPRSVSSLTPQLFRTQPYPYGFPIPLLPYAILVSILLDLFAYSRFGARSGGFVTAAYLALFAVRPFDLMFVAVAAVLTYGFVWFITTYVVLAFGRIKMGITILSGVVISWLLEIIVINLSGGYFIPWSGFVVIMPTIAALIANDFDREGATRTSITTALTGAGVFVVMQGVVFLLNLMNLSWFYAA